MPAPFSQTVRLLVVSHQRIRPMNSKGSLQGQRYYCAEVALAANW